MADDPDDAQPDQDISDRDRSDQERDEQIDHDPSGLNLARTVASAISRQRGRPRRRPNARRARVIDPRSAGAHPDDRDPQLLTAALDRLVDSQGWSREVSVHTLLGTWPKLVGPDNAAHSMPVGYQDTVLTVRAESTAWATQLRLIAPMILGALLNPVNSSMIAVALVPIGMALGAPPSETAWLVSSLYLATAIGQPVVGRLVDLYGPRPLYLVGTALVGVAGVLGALAPSLGVLVAARVLLGFGTCAGYPAAMSLVRSEATRTGRESPNGILTALAVAGQTVAVVGPTAGGLLIGLGGWRSTFTINIPLAIVCLVMGARRLPRSPRTRRSASLASTVDLTGIALFAGMLVALLLFLMTPQLAHTPLLAVTVAAGAGLVWWERRATTPFLDLDGLGGNLPLLATYARTLLTAVVSYAVLYGYTQWLEEGRGLSPTAAGLLLIPMSLTGILVATATGRRTEVRGKLLVGAAAQVVAGVGMLLLDAGSAIWMLVALALVLGLPQGLNNLANQNAMYHQADPARTASSAGLYRTFFYLGAIAAASANGVVLRDGADTAGLHHLAEFLIPCSVLFLLLTVVDRSLRRLGTQPASATTGS